MESLCSLVIVQPNRDSIVVGRVNPNNVARSVIDRSTRACYFCPSSTVAVEAEIWLEGATSRTTTTLQGAMKKNSIQELS